MRCCMYWAEWVDCRVAALLAMTARVFAVAENCFCKAEDEAVYPFATHQFCRRLCEAEGRGSPLF